MMTDEDQQSRLFYQLCALVLSIINPSPMQPTTTISSSSSSQRTTTQVSPAAFASLLLGVSLALMLCGSVTFVIGFILMPWVLGLVMVLYFIGIITNLSLLGRALLYPFSSAITSPPPPPTMARSPKQLSSEGFRCSMLGIFPIVPF